MKFLHTADLHIGKRLFEVSLIKDQEYILSQIYDIALKEKVDAVLIAGDVYDRAVPGTEAVALLDAFLTRLVRVGILVIMISGNHDSPERVAFVDEILERQGLHIAGTYREGLKTVTLNDVYGSVSFVCMPFAKPAAAGCKNSAEAVRHMLNGVEEVSDKKQRRVLLSHYFVTGDNGESPLLSDSESEVNVGGLDNVPASLFEGFDYVALGHIHRPQRIGSGNVYYSGSPLKYSFSEARGDKSVNIVELLEPGNVKVKKHPLVPLHEMRCIRGTLAQLIQQEVSDETKGGREDYIQAVVTDEEELIDPMGTLRSVYPNVLQLVPARKINAGEEKYVSSLPKVQKGIAELFGEFYEMLKGEPMDERRTAVVKELAEIVEEKALAERREG